MSDGALRFWTNRDTAGVPRHGQDRTQRENSLYTAVFAEQQNLARGNANAQPLIQAQQLVVAPGPIPVDVSARWIFTPSSASLLPVSYPVTSIVGCGGGFPCTGGAFVIAGDHTLEFLDGIIFAINGSTSGDNDGIYTCDGNAVLNGGNTEISPVEPIPTSTADGNVRRGPQLTATGVAGSDGLLSNVDLIEPTVAFLQALSTGLFVAGQGILQPSLTYTTGPIWFVPDDQAKVVLFNTPLLKPLGAFPGTQVQVWAT